MLGLPNYMVYLFFGSFFVGFMILLAVLRFSKKSIFFFDDTDEDEDFFAGVESEEESK